MEIRSHFKKNALGYIGIILMFTLIIIPMMIAIVVNVLPSQDTALLVSLLVFIDCITLITLIRQVYSRFNQITLKKDRFIVTRFLGYGSSLGFDYKNLTISQRKHEAINSGPGRLLIVESGSHKIRISGNIYKNFRELDLYIREKLDTNP